VIGQMLRQHLCRVEPAVGADADNRRRHSKARWPRCSSARYPYKEGRHTR
jgi:hypothetical protein